MKKLILLLSIPVAAAAFYLLAPISLPPLPLSFTLEEGSLTHAAGQMQKEGILKHPFPFVLLARAMGKASSVKAGNYEIDHVLNPIQLLYKITGSDFTQSRITLVEGATFGEIRRELDQDPDLGHDAGKLSDKAILSMLGAPESSPEGLFFPDTYYFAKGQSDLSILKRSYLMMQKRLGKEWQNRAAGLPLSDPYQALTLASIVEKETGKERAMVAAVFLNRLKIGMKLQTDPTVIYGLGERYDGNLRKKDLLEDQPYNTYTRPGLPPTPISMPGLKSIDAVLHPADSKALYFVAKGDGTSYFSNSLAEHNKAVNRYQRK